MFAQNQAVRRMPSAETYDRNSQIPGENEMCDVAAAIIDDSNPAGRGVFADFCCGTLEIWPRLQNTECYRQMIGVDVNQEYLHLGAEKLFGDQTMCGTVGMTAVELVCADAVTYKLPRGARADAILLSSAVHHIEDERKTEFLRNVADNLAPGGMAVVCENILGDFSSPSQHDRRTEQFYAAKIDEIRRRALDRDLIPVVEDIVARGLERNCEFKMSYRTFLDLVRRTGFQVSQETKVWPAWDAFDDARIGDFVFVLKKRPEAK